MKCQLTRKGNEKTVDETPISWHYRLYNPSSKQQTPFEKATRPLGAPEKPLNFPPRCMVAMLIQAQACSSLGLPRVVFVALEFKGTRLGTILHFCILMPCQLEVGYFSLTET